MNDTQRILIADDDRDLVEALALRFQELGYDVSHTHDGISALTLIHNLRPDLVILDVNMPGGSGLGVCEMMSGDQELEGIPVVVLTGSGDPETIKRCHNLCAMYVNKGPELWSRIEPLLEELLGDPAAGQSAELSPEPEMLESETLEGELAMTVTKEHGDATASVEDAAACEQDCARSGSPQGALVNRLFSAFGWGQPSDDRLETQFVERPWILCIDDDADFSFALKMRLQAHDVEVLRAFDGMDGFRYAFSTKAQAIILDYEMPEANGDYVLRRLKDNPVTSDIPVVVLTGKDDRMLERKMYGLGAARFLVKPASWEQIWEELQRHIQLAPPVC